MQQTHLTAQSSPSSQLSAASASNAADSSVKANTLTFELSLFCNKNESSAPQLGALGVKKSSLNKNHFK